MKKIVFGTTIGSGEVGFVKQQHLDIWKQQLKLGVWEIVASSPKTQSPTIDQQSVTLHSYNPVVRTKNP